jgi:hypothetical protein
MLPLSKLKAPIRGDQHPPTSLFKALDQRLTFSFQFLKTLVRRDQCRVAETISKICEFAGQDSVILDCCFDT